MRLADSVHFCQLRQIELKVKPHSSYDCNHRASRVIQTALFLAYYSLCTEENEAGK